MKPRQPTSSIGVVPIPPVRDLEDERDIDRYIIAPSRLEGANFFQGGCYYEHYVYDRSSNLFYLGVGH